MMLVFTLLIAAAIVFNTAPGPCVHGLALVFGPLAYALSVWVAVMFAFVISLVVIELLALIVGGVARLVLP